MLVLARREGEKLIIGNGAINVTVLSVTGKIVRLGFEASEDIRIVRAEVPPDSTEPETNTKT